MAISIPHRAEHHRRHLSRGRTARILLGLAFVPIAVAGIAVSRTSLLHARDIQVSGVSSLSRAQAVAVAGVNRHTNVLWFDEAAAERRLEANPWVASAAVSVSLPWSIEIAVVERTAVAVASDGRGEVLVAADGTSLGAPRRPADTRGLPKIDLSPTGFVEGSPQSPVGAARAIGAMPPDLRAQVSRVSILLDGTLEVWLRSGPRVGYGRAEQVGAKADAIARALWWAEQEREQILSLSVVSPTAPAATLAP